MTNLAEFLETSARTHPGRTALVFEDRRMSYFELDEAVRRVSGGLRAAGLGPGDHIALCCPNRPEFVIACYAILGLGATVVTLSALSRAGELAYYLEDSDACALICHAGHDGALGRAAIEAADRVDRCRRVWLAGGGPDDAVRPFDALTEEDGGGLPIAPVAADQTAVILYTSGTTGRPKGAELTHANIVSNVRALRDMFPVDRPQALLVALPLFHVMAQTCLMHQGLYAGDALVLMERFEPGAALELMVREAITRFMGVPTMYRALLDHAGIDAPAFDRAAAGLEWLNCGGAPLPEALAEAFEERSGLPMGGGYGCTETSPVCVVHPLGEERRPGSVGTAIPGVEVRIVDGGGAPLSTGEIGEVAVRGHCVMKGYYKRPAETAEAIRDGWYYTGDLGRLDDDGHLYIVGRSKELIIRGGFNVYPAEVEGALMRHPGVAAAAVIGVADDHYGEEVKAFVVPEPGASLTPDEIVAWSREAMAAHKYPRLVELRDDLPLTVTGKVAKRELV